MPDSSLPWGRTLGPQDPVRMGPYTVLRLLGEGGMGRVFLVRGRGMRLYALKTIHPHLAHEPGFRARFAHEGRAAQRVAGAFTAPVVEVSGPEEPMPWLTTAFIPAPSLDTVVTGCGVMPERALWWLAAGIAEALQSVHGAGLLHRDLKPGNVLVAEDGPRVIDFGIAKALQASVGPTSTGRIVGTVGFMAPELLRGRAVPASDVFALGALLTHAATARPPFTGPDMFAVITATLLDPPNLDGVPDGITDLLAACLDKDPDRRPQPVDVLDRARRYAGPDTTTGTHGVRGWLPDPACALIENHARPTPRNLGEAETEEGRRDKVGRRKDAARVRVPGTGADGRVDAGTTRGTHREPTTHPGTLLGPDHPDTLLTRETRDLYAALVPDRARVLGPDHPDTLLTRSMHAYWAGKAGDAGEARDLYAALVRDRTRVLGPDHPNTLHTREAHAEWAGNAGDAGEARDLYADLVPDRARALGPDHPDTLHTREAHAEWAGNAGDAGEARDLYAALVPDRTRVHGPDHPSTLDTRAQHASRVGEAGDAGEARDLYAALVPDRTRVLGPDHPSTLNTREAHGYWAGQAGDAVTARDLFAALVPDRTRVLGPGHPNTLHTREAHAEWAGKAGDAGGARDLFAALVPDRTRVLGPDHPNTLLTRSMHAYWAGKAGDAGEARDLYAALVRDRTRVLGPDHPNILLTRGMHAYWAGEAGGAGQARDLYAALVRDRTRADGPDHPGTLNTREAHGYWAGQAGDAVTARDLFAALVPDRTRVLGPDHPDTLHTLGMHAYWAGMAETDGVDHEGDTEG